MNNLLRCVTASLIGWSSTIYAGFITVDEVALDQIFSQPSIGLPGGIDVRVNAYQEVVEPDLATVDSFLEINQLWNTTPYPYPAIDLFFVDALNYCAGTSWASGCARLNYPRVIVSSRPASSRLGSALIAHEIGHAFGLLHRRVGGNLTNPIITGGTEIFPDEGDIIRRSPLLQRDHTGYFMEINPIAVVTEPTLVTEPRGLLLSVALGLLVLLRLINPRLSLSRSGHQKTSYHLTT